MNNHVEKQNNRLDQTHLDFFYYDLLIIDDRTEQVLKNDGKDDYITTKQI